VSEKLKVIDYLKYLGVRLDVSDFESCFLLQKIAFILKDMGLPLEYNFTFWRYGTYSKKLADDYYTFKEDFINEPEHLNINNSEKQILDKFREVLNLDRLQLEAVSTILYFDLQYKDLNEVITKFKKVKPHIADRDILSAQNKSKQLKFKDEFLTLELKTEIESWESVDD
jgi:uncharacterized protein YwgA